MDGEAGSEQERVQLSRWFHSRKDAAERASSIDEKVAIQGLVAKVSERLLAFDPQDPYLLYDHGVSLFHLAEAQEKACVAGVEESLLRAETTFRRAHYRAALQIRGDFYEHFHRGTLSEADNDMFLLHQAASLSLANTWANLFDYYFTTNEGNPTVNAMRAEKYLSRSFVLVRETLCRQIPLGGGIFKEMDNLHKAIVEIAGGWSEHGPKTSIYQPLITILGERFLDFRQREAHKQEIYGPKRLLN